MDIYKRLGVPTIINAAGTKTQFGGSLMDDGVLAAMQEASRHYVEMVHLQAAASRRIAEFTGAEAGLVTSGASAALTVGTAALLARWDPAVMNRLPDTRGIPNEIIMFRTHRNGYDHAIRAAGAQLVEVGLNDFGVGAGVRRAEVWEIERAINPNTVGIAYVVNPHDDPPFAQVAEVAKRHQLPVIVDAAAIFPNLDALREIVSAGADLVAVSGGKALRGPQGTGLLCGRRDLVASAALQMLDLDVDWDDWDPPRDFIDKGQLEGLPHHGIGRGFKVSKEDIIGLLAAIEQFPSQQAAITETLAAMAAQLENGIWGFPGVQGVSAERPQKGYPVVHVQLDSPQLARQLASALRQGNPPLMVDTAHAAQGCLTLHTATLKPEEPDLVVWRVGEVLSRLA